MEIIKVNIREVSKMRNIGSQVILNDFRNKLNTEIINRNIIEITQNNNGVQLIILRICTLEELQQFFSDNNI